ELVPLLAIVVVPLTQLGGRRDITQPPVEIRLLFRHPPGPHPVHENPGLVVRSSLRVANAQRTSLVPSHPKHLLVTPFAYHVSREVTPVQSRYTGNVSTPYTMESSRNVSSSGSTASRM